MKIDDIILELEKFSIKIAFIGSATSEENILNFENKFKIRLPDEYKQLVRKHNGIRICGVNIYGIKEPDNSYSLEECYFFEHYEVENKMPAYLIPFSPDGGGNHYCFDTRFANKEFCPIIFWQHDYDYSEKDTPEITNQNFADWIKIEMIDWALEDYNYNGSQK